MLTIPSNVAFSVKCKLPPIRNEEEESKHMAEYEVPQTAACAFQERLLLYAILFPLAFSQIYDKIPTRREDFQ